jgi:tetratricopeptide (TPR) repeat protein
MDRIQNSNHYKILLYALMIILALFIFRIMLRNMEWGDPVKFYENEIKYEKRYHLQSARIYNNLAMEQADRGDCAKAIPNYQKAISLNDTYPQTHHNLARCFESTGQIKEAADEYFKALYIQPNFLYSLNAISKLLAAVGDKRSVKFSQLEEKASNGEAINERDLLEAAR